MTARVVFTAGFSRRYTDGVREFEIEAKNLRGVIREMDKLYPGLGHHLEEETTVAIDGQTHETVKSLTAAGFTDAQAEALTAAVKRAVDIDLSNIATKTDIVELRREMS